MKLIKKDLLVFKKFILITLIYYLLINFCMMFLIILSKIEPWKVIPILVFQTTFLSSLTIFIEIGLFILFNYLLFTKENYPFVYSLNISSKKLFISKFILGCIYGFITIILYLIWMILNDLFQIGHIPIESYMDHYLNSQFPKNLLLFLWIYLISIDLIHNFAIFSVVLKKFHTNIKMLLQLFILFVYCIVILFCSFTISFYVMNISLTLIQLMTVFMFICSILIMIFNEKLLKRVDI